MSPLLGGEALLALRRGRGGGTGVSLPRLRVSERLRVSMCGVRCGCGGEGQLVTHIVGAVSVWYTLICIICVHCGGAVVILYSI